MKIKRKSFISGIEREIDIPVTEEQLFNYSNGMLLQEAFPNLSVGLREFIKTGITEEEWDSYFE